MYNNDQDAPNYINLSFLNTLAKGKQMLIDEMISAYLEETPRIIANIKTGIEEKDWDLVAKASHSLLPSFHIMGINQEYADMTQQINTMAEKKEKPEEISALFLQIESVCAQAGVELREEQSAVLSGVAI